MRDRSDSGYQRGENALWPARLPAEVLEVFAEFRTCEATTIAKDGTPITWPLYPFWRSARGIFQFTTSVGLPTKAHNIRRNSKFAMLFSDPTGSGLDDPPAVLVQAEAVCGTEVLTDMAGYEADAVEVFQRQPAARLYGIDPISRWLFGWYYWRWIIDVTPVRISWWLGGDFSQSPQTLDVEHVG